MCLVETNTVSFTGLLCQQYCIVCSPYQYITHPVHIHVVFVGTAAMAYQKQESPAHLCRVVDVSSIGVLNKQGGEV